MRSQPGPVATCHQTQPHTTRSWAHLLCVSFQKVSETREMSVGVVFSYGT